MLIIKELDVIVSKKIVAAIGFFDGVHVGHRSLISRITALALKRGASSAVITFSVHPREVLQPDYRLPLIHTLNERMSALASTGLDYCILINFTQALSQMSARQFLELLHSQYSIDVLFVGFNHRFGHNRSEGFADYVRYGQELGMEIIRSDAFHPDGIQVSSSIIRKNIGAGEIETANKWLSSPYSLEGIVEAGHQIGRTLGFPTANLAITHPEKIIPQSGVYAVQVDFNGNRYNGMLNIGKRPTVNNGSDQSIEVNLFDFEGSLYGETLRLYFIARLRGEVRFSGLEQLRLQLQKDKEHALRILLPLLAE